MVSSLDGAWSNVELSSEVSLELATSVAGPSSPGPGFDPGDVFGLDFDQVLFSAPADSPAEVVIDKGGRPTVKIDPLVDQSTVEECKEDR